MDTQVPLVVFLVDQAMKAVHGPSSRRFDNHKFSPKTPVLAAMTK